MTVEKASTRENSTGVKRSELQALVKVFPQFSDGPLMLPQGASEEDYAIMRQFYQGLLDKLEQGLSRGPGFEGEVYPIELNREEIITVYIAMGVMLAPFQAGVPLPEEERTVLRALEPLYQRMQPMVDRAHWNDDRPLTWGVD